MGVKSEDIKTVRAATNASLIECKKALAEANNDIDKAIEILRKKGIAKAVKKESRETKEGIIVAYIHHNGRFGVMLEANCETDFVAKNEKFKEMAYNIAMHIVSANPLYVSREDVPEEVIEKEKEIYRQQMKDSNKPENIIEKIIENKLNKYFEDFCLLEQPYSKDNSIKVMDYIKQHITTFGENINISRFVRYEVGVN